MFAYCNNSPVIFNDSNGTMMTCCVNVADGGGGKKKTRVMSLLMDKA